ncbi:hypothetical protein HYPSUDRAFT_92250 [Hypholoma sublateritium FD-334 SS-4]|uniref:Uncharacterized protein n=1 Tax=Hypholoma sublateritium (strain FD-334 SS-4) TaxID=945553 RepID=A0A0D2KJB0_HYPSF|nr:hypothetical protein HYPSUDRAFT_92250 [Hypholoma sublateritium FD-334 SS-4]
MTITVIVDDNDPAIVYGGAWTALHPSALGISGINQTIGNTLHNTSIGETGQESFFSYNFTGNMISVSAMMMAPSELLGGLPYAWKCTVDQQPTNPILLSAVDMPATIKLCQATDLPDGPHLFNFSFVIPEGSDIRGSVFFDYIEYHPSASGTPRTYGFTAVSFDDPSLSYFGSGPLEGWNIESTDDNTSGFLASVLNPNSTASVTLEFNGTSLTWIGFADPGFSVSSTYSIDSQPEIQFNIPPLDNAFLLPGRVLFETSPLNSNVTHTITAQYAASTLLHQLSVQSIVIGNGIVPANLSVAATTTTSSRQETGTSHVQPNTSSTRPAHHPPVPVIVGIVAGVSVVAFIVVSAIIWKRHRQRRVQHPPFVQPFSSQPASFIARLLTYPSAAAFDIKGRRRLLPPIEEPAHPGIIPPSKLATRRVSAAAADTTDPTPVPTQGADGDNEANNADSPPVRRARMRQEEDSGLRMVEQLEADEESSVVVMPPAYTAE